MSEWLEYRKVAITEMRPYLEGEDLSKISVQPEYTPKPGDLVARDPAKPEDQWLVAQEFAAANYERV
jgi:hypothetical protein